MSHMIDDREYVRWAYRIFLGREPESEAVVENNPFLGNRRALVESFVNSEEFQSSHANAPGSLLPLSRLISGKREDVQNEIRRRCTSNYLGNREALCRALGRYSMFVNTDDVGFATHIMMSGAWEMWLTEHMVRTIKPGWTTIDVGANFGYYSLMISDLVQHTGRCIAFEPNPNVARLLRQTLSVNGFADRSDVREVALSGEEGASYFYLPHNEPKNARLVPEIDHWAVEQNLGVFINVPTMTLDAAAPDRVDFIKIDAEGAEGAIINGMMGLLKRDRPEMVIEYNCARMADPRSPLERLLSVYGSMQSLEMDGEVYSTTIDQILSERVGQDWLLVLR